MVHPIHQAAKDYADKIHGQPTQWTPITGLTEECFNMNIQDAFLAGYNSRNSEVSNLQGEIKELVEALRIGSALISAYNIRFPNAWRLLVGYSNTGAIKIVQDTSLKFLQKQTTNL